MGIECGKGGDPRPEGVHGVAVLDYVQDLVHFIRDVPVKPELRVKVPEFGRVGKLPHEQQVHDLFEGGLFSQVVDVVTPVQQLAHFTVYETGLAGVQVYIL